MKEAGRLGIEGSGVRGYIRLWRKGRAGSV
jgi:hypothetical protein